VLCLGRGDLADRIPQLLFETQKEMTVEWKKSYNNKQTVVVGCKRHSTKENGIKREREEQDRI
jgi:hypothetical protein